MVIITSLLIALCFKNPSISWSVTLSCPRVGICSEFLANAGICVCFPFMLIIIGGNGVGLLKRVLLIIVFGIVFFTVTKFVLAQPRPNLLPFVFKKVRRLLQKATRAQIYRKTSILASTILTITLFFRIGKETTQNAIFLSYNNHPVTLDYHRDYWSYKLPHICSKQGHAAILSCL